MIDRAADLSPTVLEPPGAESVFGARLPLARRYAALLAEHGVLRGLIGPHEIERLWDRHLLNCAVLTDLLPLGARVIDVGSGAGLPGLPMAIRRPDLQIDLVEPMLRRSTFLDEAVASLGISGEVRVIRGRAESPAVRKATGSVNWVTARAVARLDRLVEWCLPLLAPGGTVLALKGRRAAEEVAEHRRELERLHVRDVRVVPLGNDVLVEPTWVVIVRRLDGPE